MEKPPRRFIELEGAQSRIYWTWGGEKKLERDLISEFLSVSHTEDTSKARQWLESTNWDFNRAVINYSLSTDHDTAPPTNKHVSIVGYNFFAWVSIARQERRRRSLKRKLGWEEKSSSSSSSSGGGGGGGQDNNLEAMFRPSRHLIFIGTLEEAAFEAQTSHRWLLLNLQSVSEFSSHVLNRDVWSNEAVSDIVRANFVFWQEYNDTVEGLELMDYFKLDSVPAILVVDPATGQMMRSWFGVVEPEALLEGLLLLMDKNPTKKDST